MGDRLGTPGVVGFSQFLFFLASKLSGDRSDYHFWVRDGAGKNSTGVGQVGLSSTPLSDGTGQLGFFWILIQFFKEKGASADAGPHYQKLYGRVTTLVAIAEVSPSEVQCKGLTLEETPP